MLPLEGIKVIDLSTVVLGALAGQLLGDYGAEVIKVEAPGGDTTRKTGPAAEPGMGAIFLGVNRNKQGVVIDLKQQAGRDALLRLIGSADVFVHNVRPQKLAALGLAPEAVLQRFPRLVYAGLHGFGAGGPYAGNPAYDDIVQGLSGSAGLMQSKGGGAEYFPTIVADKVTAHVAVHAILAALLRRGRTGQGGFVEIPMMETMAAFNLVEHMYGLHFEPPRAAPGYPRILTRHRRPFRTADGHVCMMPYTDKNWHCFFAEAGEPALAADTRFLTIQDRTRNIDALYEIAAGLIERRTTAAWLEACARLDIPAAPMNRLEDLPADPHLAATGFFVDVDDERMGRLRFPGGPVRFDGERAPLRIPPRLGEHTRQALIAAGLTDAEVDELIRSGAARQAEQPITKEYAA